MRLGPDEHTYTRHAELWARADFPHGLRAAAEAYLTDAGARDYPSSLRWGWAAFLNLTMRMPAVFAALASLVSLAVSPLLLHLARRRLQDTAVASFTCAAVANAANGHHALLPITFAWLLALKPEGAILAAPAILFAATSQTNAMAMMALGGVAWALASAWLFGPHLFARLVRALLQSHDTDYGRQQQRGMWHRLFIDLAIASPVWVGLALWYHPATLLPALFLVVAHAMTPVRNVRTVLAADLLMRAALYPVAPWWAIVAAYASDAWLLWRARGIGLYDTPTGELVRAALTGRPR